MEKLDLLEHQSLFIGKLTESGKSFNTIKNYRTDLNIYKNFLTENGRPLIINEVTLSEVNEYTHYLNKKYDSPNSIRRRVQALRIFFDYLIGQKYFDVNPMKKIAVQPKVVDLPRPTKFHLVQKLKAYIEANIERTTGHEQLLHQRNLILFYLIYGAGLKVSDIERLSIEHIRKSRNMYRIIVAPEKRDPFTVTLPKEFEPVFEEYVKALTAGKARDEVVFHQLLFNGNPFRIIKGGLSARGIEVIFKEFSNKIGERITAKYLRQACIFKWLCQKIQIARIKEWMGVQPQYSLGPYQALLEEKPDEFCYLEV